MSLCLDIYTLIHNRERESIERFLSTYIDRNAQENRGNEELMILPSSKLNQKELALDDYDWVITKTLTNSIAYGLSDSTNCFSLYFPSIKPKIYQVSLSFTYDGKLVFGLEIDDWKQTKENLDLAEKLMDNLMKQFKGKTGAVVFEIPPPISEVEFEKLLHNDRTFRFRQLENDVRYQKGT